MTGIFIANAVMRVGFVCAAVYLATHDHLVMAGWLVFAAIVCGISTEEKVQK